MEGRTAAWKGELGARKEGDCLMAQQVKNQPEIRRHRRPWIHFLGQEGTLEREMATYSCILALEVQWTEEYGRYSPKGLRESDMTEQLSTHPHNSREL